MKFNWTKITVSNSKLHEIAGYLAIDEIIYQQNPMNYHFWTSEIHSGRKKIQFYSFICIKEKREIIIWKPIEKSKSAQ